MFFVKITNFSEQLSKEQLGDSCFSIASFIKGTLMQIWNSVYMFVLI